MQEEEVLVVSRSKLFACGEFRGFSRENIKSLLSIIENESFFMERKRAEQNPSHKQIIPYAVLVSNDKIFTVTRLNSQGESRLHQKVSIGLGGHINPEDIHPSDKSWESGLKRELSEEICLDGEWKANLIGFLNDDETPVGSVHFGLVYRVELISGCAAILEKDKMTGAFLQPDEAALQYEKMESWSQLVFSAFWSGHVNASKI